MPKDDLYKALNVDASADKDSIKKAYKKAAKKAHPDIEGGSSKKFALVKKAFDILSDEERRSKYDATGDESEKNPDNKFSEAVNTISFALGMVLQKCAESGESPLVIDLMSQIRGVIKRNMEMSQAQIRVLKNVLSIDEKLQGRFTSDEQDIFLNIILNRITSLKMNIQNAEKIIETGNEALRLLNDIRFRKDEKPYESPGDIMMRHMRTY